MCVWSLSPLVLGNEDGTEPFGRWRYCRHTPVSIRPPLLLHLHCGTTGFPTVMTSVLHSIFAMPAIAVYALAGALAFGEAVFLLGFVLPGETAVILGGVAASQGRVSLTVMIAVVAIGAILGDSLSYEIGRRFGPGLLARPWFKRRKGAVRSAQRLMTRWGAWMVIVGRATAYIRPIVPALAGAASMPYRQFLLANAAGGVAWAATFSALGFAMGNAYTKASGTVHWTGLAVLVLGAAAALVVHWRRRYADRDPSPAQPVVNAKAADTVNEVS